MGNEERIDRARKYKAAYEHFAAAQAKLAILRKVPESTENRDLNIKVDRLIREAQEEIAATAVEVVKQIDENKDLTKEDFEVILARENANSQKPGGQYL